MQDHFSPQHVLLPPRRRAVALRAGCGPAACLVLTASLMLSGCKLVDQRTFDRSADRAPVPHPLPGPPPPPAKPPLATVQFAATSDTWQPGLSAIVAQALARKPTALFRVETHLPQVGTPEAQAMSLAGTGAKGGQQVADTIIGAGASSAQIEMSATTDPAVKQPEVLVYVQ